MTISSISFDISGTLGELVESGVLSLGLFFLHIQVSTKTDPKMLPAFNSMLKIKSFTPAQLAIEIAFINFLRLLIHHWCRILLNSCIILNSSISLDSSIFLSLWLLSGLWFWICHRNLSFEVSDLK